MKEIEAFYGKRVRVCANLQEGTRETSRRTEGRGRVIPEDQCRMDLNFSAWAQEDTIQISVWIKKSDKSKALAMINNIPKWWFTLQVVYTNDDAIRIIRQDNPQETFRLYPVLHVTSQRIEKR